MTASAALSQRPVVLETRVRRHQKSVGIDLFELPGVDVVGDALEVLGSLPAATGGGARLPRLRK